MKEGDMVWLAKYALSGGIKECEVESITTYSKEWVYLKEFQGNSFKIGEHVFPTKQEAINKANDMRDKKIKSLEKQIEKLKKLTF